MTHYLGSSCFCHTYIKQLFLKPAKHIYIKTPKNTLLFIYICRAKHRGDMKVRFDDEN